MLVFCASEMPLLNAKDNYQSLSSIEARALIYQKILLESEMIEKLKLLKILKDSFKKDEINNAFDEELDELVYSWGEPLDDFLATYNPPVDPPVLTFNAPYTVSSPLPGSPTLGAVHTHPF